MLKKIKKSTESNRIFLARGRVDLEILKGKNMHAALKSGLRIKMCLVFRAVNLNAFAWFFFFTTPFMKMDLLLFTVQIPHLVLHIFAHFNGLGHINACFRDFVRINVFYLNISIFRLVRSK